MKRLHWFEFMDFDWYPVFLRKPQTNILQVLMTQTNAFDYAVPYIDTLMERTKISRIVDLCSGSSGPWLRLMNQLKDANAQIILTDKYPPTEVYKILKKQTHGKLDFFEAPVDALAVPESLTGIRTLFTGFHHFQPAQVTMILKDAQDKNQAVGIFDYVPDKMLTIVLFPITFIVSFVQFYVLSFWVRPLSFQHILFTNIIPLVPIVSAWDGFVSALRKYSAAELREIVQGLDGSKYQWEIGEDYSLSKATPLTYLLGIPSREV